MKKVLVFGSGPRAFAKRWAMRERRIRNKYKRSAVERWFFLHWAGGTRHSVALIRVVKDDRRWWKVTRNGRVSFVHGKPFTSEKKARAAALTHARWHLKRAKKELAYAARDVAKFSR